MPKGAKKRKAAKKKKEQAAQQIDTTTNHGNEDQRSQDERESDDGIGSPASHDNNENHQNHFVEGDGQSRSNDLAHQQSLVADEGSAKEVSGNMNTTQKEELAEKDAIKIEKVLKPAENIEITDSSLEHGKSSGSSSSSRSSSDDEAREIVKRPEKENDESAIEVIEHSDVDKPANSLPKQAVPMSANSPFSGSSANVILETTAEMDSAKLAEPKSEEQICIESISEETSGVSAVDTVVSNEGDVKSLPNLIENAAKEFPASDEIASASSGANDFEVKENESKILPSSNPVPESKYVHEGVKETEVPVSSEKEAPAQATHPVVQRTSWLSCCGLFDVITGSSR